MVRRFQCRDATVLAEPKPSIAENDRSGAYGAALKVAISPVQLPLMFWVNVAAQLPTVDVTMSSDRSPPAVSRGVKQLQAALARLATDAWQMGKKVGLTRFGGIYFYHELLRGLKASSLGTYLFPAKLPVFRLPDDLGFGLTPSFWVWTASQPRHSYVPTAPSNADRPAELSRFANLAPLPSPGAASVLGTVHRVNDRCPDSNS